jgi:hypothetical protein
MDDQLLRIYLEDHAAGATAGLELAKKCRRENPATPLASFLDGFIDELYRDRTVLFEILGTMGTTKMSLPKRAGSWILEKASRLKLSARTARHGELARLEELELLRIAVEGKLAMWRLLLSLAPADVRLQRFALEEHEARAKAQRDGLERWRLKAARDVFTPTVVDRASPLRQQPA